MANLQKTKTAKGKGRITKVRLQEVFEGPLPHPRILNQYEQVFPGATERIFRMAEKQQEHRHKLEIAVVKSNIHNEKTGLYSSLVITLVVVISGAVLIYLGHGIEGFITLIATIGFHAYNFLNQKKKQEEELENNDQKKATY